jgi:hypothetical protein
VVPKEISGEFGNKIRRVCTKITFGPVPIKVAVPPIEEDLGGVRQARRGWRLEGARPRGRADGKMDEEG